jgi:hypothetical protein
MIKLILKICFIYTLSFTSAVQAGLIQGTHYITYDYNGVKIDVAWASNVSSERYYYGVNPDLINTLYSPDELHIDNSIVDDGWHFAEENVLSTSLLSTFTTPNGVGLFPDLLSLFTITGSNDYINAFGFWNSHTSDVSDFNIIKANKIRSLWHWSVANDIAVGLEEKDDLSTMNFTEKVNQHSRITSSGSLVNYDTFYFRVHDVQTGNTTSVPEPSTLMIFSLGLIALVSKKRLFS